MGAEKRYSKRVRVQRAVDVYSTANMDQAARSNRIGELDARVVVRAEGPLHYGAEGRAGVAYAVALRDTRGRLCRGYVDGAAVEVLNPLAPG